MQPRSLEGFRLKISFNLIKGYRHPSVHPYRFVWDIGFRNEEISTKGLPFKSLMPDYAMRLWKKYDYSNLIGG